MMKNINDEEESKNEIYFLKHYSTVLNQLIEENISDIKRENIKVIIFNNQSFTEELKVLKNKGNNGIVDQILTMIRYSLSESLYIRQSYYLRYLLKNIFNVKLSYVS
jgi:hypothetical protein